MYRKIKKEKEIMENSEIDFNRSGHIIMGVNEKCE